MPIIIVLPILCLVVLAAISLLVMQNEITNSFLTHDELEQQTVSAEINVLHIIDFKIKINNKRSR